MDISINTFFIALGGRDFLALIFAILIILAIIMAITRPLDF